MISSKPNHPKREWCKPALLAAAILMAVAVVPSRDAFAKRDAQETSPQITAAASFVQGAGDYSAEQAKALFQYTTGKNGVTIQTYLGKEGLIILPDSVEGVPVTGIAGGAFSLCPAKSLYIPAGVKDIAPGALSFSSIVNVEIAAGNRYYCFRDGLLFNRSKTTLIGCPHIAAGAVTIPEGVKTVGESAFAQCESITSVQIPNGVTSIGDQAFLGCAGLKRVVLPDGLTKIGEAAFSFCFNMTELEIPDSVTSIGRLAFSGCWGKTEFVIPDGVTSIGLAAFQECIGLQKARIPAGVKQLGEEMFSSCEYLKSVEIEEGVTAVPSGTFRGCMNLTDVTLPKSVKTIADDAFDGAEKVIIRCPAGSYAETYAEEHGYLPGSTRSGTAAKKNLAPNVTGYVFTNEPDYDSLCMTNGHGAEGEYYSYSDALKGDKTLKKIKSGDYVELTYADQQGKYGMSRVITGFKLLESSKIRKKTARLEDFSTGSLTFIGDTKDYWVPESCVCTGYTDYDMEGRKATVSYVEMEGNCVALRVYVQ